MEERKSNFELLRIVAIVMVLISHCTLYGVLRSGSPYAYENWKDSGLLYQLISAFSIVGNIGVGLFFTITGYFFIQRDSSFNNIYKTVKTTLFYAVFLIIILIGFNFAVGVFQYHSRGEIIISLAQMLFVPITGSVWWYVTAYIALMLVAPSYNRFLRRLNQSGLIVWLLCLLVFGYTLGNLGSAFHDFEKALFFYTLGGFLSYGAIKHNRLPISILFSIIGFTLNGLFQFGTLYFMTENTGDVVLYRKIFSMLSIMIADPVAVIGLFGLFSSIKIQSRLINKISPHVFGIYLFHEAPLMRTVLWEWLLQPYKYFNSKMYIPCLIVCGLIVFFLGLVVDIVRAHVFDKALNTVLVNIYGKVKERLVIH